MRSSEILAAYQKAGAPLPPSTTAVSLVAPGILIVKTPFGDRGIFAFEDWSPGTYVLTARPSLLIQGTPSIDASYFCPVVLVSSERSPTPSLLAIFISGSQQWLLQVTVLVDSAGSSKTSGVLCPVTNGQMAIPDPLPPDSLSGPATIGPVDADGSLTATITVDGQVITVVAVVTISMTALMRFLTPSAVMIDPDHIPIGGQTVIKANWFDSREALTVTLDGVPAPGIASPTASSVGWFNHLLTLPSSLAPGPHTVVVAAALSGTALRGQLFVMAAPTITALLPVSGWKQGGNAVVMSGANLGAATSLAVGDQDNPFTATGDSQITFTIPSGFAGSVDIVVTTPWGSAKVTYTYIEPPPILVQSMDPSMSRPAGGIEVTFTGSNFSTVTSVTFGGVPVSFSIVNDSLLKAVAPSGVGGVYVTLTSAEGASAQGGTFIYVPPGPPEVDLISPNSGPSGGGVDVSITGRNFASLTGVAFGNGVALVMKSLTDTEVVVVAPAGTGTVPVIVVTSQGRSDASQAQFTYVG
jgi:hypothetical protein